MGFEPMHIGVKDQCLTAWLPQKKNEGSGTWTHINEFGVHHFTIKLYQTKKIGQGGIRTHALKNNGFQIRRINRSATCHHIPTPATPSGTPTCYDLAPITNVNIFTNFKQTI